MARPRAQFPRDSILSIRVSTRERGEIEAAAATAGCISLGEYLRSLHEKNSRSNDLQSFAGDYGQPTKLEVFHRTHLGKILHGNSLEFLFSRSAKKSVDLIMTSPPFGLVRKKTYGNEDAHRYCDWFRPYAEGFRRVLKDNGSLVIDIAGVWKKGTPTRSLYHFELLLMLCEKFGFHLCQEHYWWNPSRLPTPAEWVNVRRVRVKDAINCIWWLSPTPWPKANNRRVLSRYSPAMLDLLKRGYKSKLRPSGHAISTKFGRNNGGSVPPNLIAIANTESNGDYQEYCRKLRYPIHPARFPSQLPEYFIRMLTDPGDLVVDPFAGSCVTGAVAESLERRWVCCELEKDYLKGAMARFKNRAKVSSLKEVTYSIGQPCALPIDEQLISLARDGGKAGGLDR